MVSQKTIYTCPPCLKTKRRSRLDEATTDKDRYQALLDAIEGIKDEVQGSNRSVLRRVDQQADDIKEMKLQLDSYYNLIEDNSKRVGGVELSVNEIKTELGELKSKQTSVNNDMNLLREITNDVEQKGLEKTVEICGYPNVISRNPLEIIKKIGDAIGYPVSDAMIDDYYVIKPNANFAGLLVVTFTRKLDKQAFYVAARKKEDFTTRSMGFLTGEPIRIYVNNCLTYYNRKLLKSCKEFKNRNNFSFVWVKNGHIFVKKDDTRNSKAKVIKSAAALLQFEKSVQDETKNGSTNCVKS